MYRLKYCYSQEEGKEGSMALLSKLTLTKRGGNFLWFHCGFEEVLGHAFCLSVCSKAHRVAVERNKERFKFDIKSERLKPFFRNICSLFLQICSPKVCYY